MIRLLSPLVRRRSLKGALTVLLLSILLPVLAVQAGIYWSWYRSQKQREVEANMEMARAVAATVDGYVEDLFRQERAIGVAFASLRPMTPEQMTQYLHVVARKYPAVRNMAWIDPEGRVVASTEPRSLGLDVRSRPYFASVLAGKEKVITDLLMPQLTGKPTVAVLLGCRDEEERLEGVVAAYLDPDRLNEILKVKRGSNGAIIVADGTGKVVYRYPEMPMTWSQRDWLKPAFAKLGAFGGREVSGIITSTFDGRRRIVADVPVPSAGWVVGASRDEAIVVGPIWSGVVRDSLFLLFAAGAALAGASLASRKLSENLRRLRDQALRFGAGELEGQVQVEGPREFIQLAESLERMARELACREEERQQLAEAERQALERAASAYERTHRVLESIREPFFSFDADWKFTYINREAERLWRKSREGMLGRSVFDFFPEEKDESFYTHFRRALREKVSVAFEARSGTSGRWAEVRAYPFEDGLWVYFRDIDERRRAQDDKEALIRRVETEHAMLEAVLQQMPVGVLITEAVTGRVLDSNGQVARILGHADDGRVLLPGSTAPGFHSDGRPYRPDEWPLFRSLEKGEVVSAEEISFVDAEGTARVLSVSSSPIRNHDGSIFAGVCIVQDLTDTARAARELRESEERFRAVFENAPISIAIVDAEGRIVTANRAAHQFLGFSVEELAGVGPAELLHEEDLSEALNSLRRLIGGDAGRTDPVERRYRRKDGGWVWGLTVASTVRDTKGCFRFGIHMFENVTETKRLQERLFQAQKRESLGYLAAGVAHDFNNLLAVVAGNSELAQLEVLPESRAARHLAQIEAAARRAAELTAKMLDYAGESPSTLEETDLSQVLRDVLDGLEAAVPENVSLAKDIPADLPTLEADPSQMRQVVLSLVTNALEAVGERQGAIRVRVGTMRVDSSVAWDGYRGGERVDGPYVFVEVADTGCGMDEETRARIFDPFFTTKFTGRGLGLAAVLGIVRSHGGGIRAVSTPGEGATFTVLLPVRAASAVVRPGVPREEAPGPERPDSGTVLVIEDEEQVREIAQAVLREIGFDVLTAGDGVEGVECFREKADEILAVLLDMTMPRMGGRETLREIHRMRPDVPVIVASGYSQQDAAAQFGSEQPTAFIQKPFRLKDLERMVLAVAHRH